MKRNSRIAGSGLLKAAERAVLNSAKRKSPAGELKTAEKSRKTAAAPPASRQRLSSAKEGVEPPSGAAVSVRSRAVSRREIPPESSAPRRKPDLPLRIIGVDPGLASTGWGVLEFANGRLRYIAHGCIETGTEIPRGERLELIYKSFLKVLKTHKPAGAAIENLYFGKNISSAMTVAEARGVLLLALSVQGLRAMELTPNAIKKAVVGITKADKNQVQEMVRLLLGLKEIPAPNHAADALGAAICAAHSGSLAHSGGF